LCYELTQTLQLLSTRRYTAIVTNKMTVGQRMMSIGYREQIYTERPEQ